LLAHTISCLSEQDAVLLWHRGDNRDWNVGFWNDEPDTLRKAFVCEVSTPTVTSEAPTCVYGPAVSLSGLTLDEVYQPNQDYYVQMAMTGTHIFTAMAEWGYGWHDGWWEFTRDDTNATIAGGSTTGTVDAGQSFGLVVVPPDVDSVTLHIRTGWTGADLSWSIDDGA